MTDAGWITRALQGEIRSEAALDMVRGIRAQGSAANLIDRKLIQETAMADPEWEVATRADGWGPLRVVEDAELVAAWEVQNSQNSQISQGEKEWPTLHPDALHGIAGDVVRYLAPHTEADPAALLSMLLWGFGGLAGPGSHVKVGGTRHPARDWFAIVGDTASGKGQSYADMRELLTLVDRAFYDTRIMSGFGSGEIVVDEVADRADDDERPTEKRLLIQAGELSGVLTVCNREGSTLSPILREAWDGNPIEARSRAKVSVAKDHHIGVLGHITPTELRKKLTETQAANGFANRFLYVLARSQRDLPFGGNADRGVLADFAKTLISRARRVYPVGERLGWTPAGDAAWREAYHGLKHDAPGGLLESVIGRGRAHALRLAVTYALLDGVDRIDEVHVRAGLAFWRYCRASAAYIFGDALGDEVADTLVRAIRDATCPHCGSDRCHGLSVTDQSKLFGRHQKGERLAQARDELERQGLIETVQLPSLDGTRAPRVSFSTGRSLAKSANSANSGLTDRAEPPIEARSDHGEEAPPIEVYAEEEPPERLLFDEIVMEPSRVVAWVPAPDHYIEHPETEAAAQHGREANPGMGPAPDDF